MKYSLTGKSESQVAESFLNKEEIGVGQRRIMIQYMATIHSV
jgi:hypothetical protein